MEDQADCLEQQLYYAVFFQDFVKFEKLLSHLPEEFDVDFVIDCEREENSLVLLSCAKPVKFIRLLTERGANLFITTPSKKNALHIACEYGRLDVVKFLVENVKDKLDFLVESLDGRTVLHYALRAEQHQEEIINYLKSRVRLNVNQVLSSGLTVLLEKVSAGDIETTETLLRHGADPNIGISGTYKAIHIASQQPDNAKMIQLLLDHGANKDELWRHGQRPIHLAIKHGLTNNVSILLHAGSNFQCRVKLRNRKYRNISTACLMAWKCPTLVPNLLNRGANPNDIHSPSGSTVLGFVLENYETAKLIESVIRLGADPKGSHRGNPVVNYCQTLDQCFVFLEHGIPLESIERGIGKSLLRLAMAKHEQGNQETIERRIKTLLSHGAKLHDTPKYAKSELMLAIERRFFLIANDFIALGADLNHVDGSENTALHIICEQNHLWTKADRDTYFVNFIRKMEKAGIDFNATNKEGMTPLLCHLNGSTNPDVSIFRLLISCGADIYALHPSSKKSILAHAIQNTQTKILDVVLETRYDVNKPESNGLSPILSCIPLDSSFKRRVFEELLQRGASANVRDSEGISLLEHVLHELEHSKVTKKEWECSTALRDIVDAGFHLDVPLSNGLFPLEMVCKHKYTDTLLLRMFRSVTDLHIFFPRGKSLLYCLLDKHPLTIRTFIERNMNLPLKTKNGRSAFDIYTEMTFHDANCVYNDPLIPGHNKCFDIFFFRAKLSMRKSNPSLPIFKEPYVVKLGRTVGEINKERVSSMLPKYKALTELNMLEFEDEQLMLDAMDLNETVLKNRPEHFYYVNKDNTETGLYDISNTMGECCRALEDLIEYEHVSVNDMLSWGIYPICVAVRLRSPALVRFMLDKGADPNVMDSWNETPLSLSIMLQHPEIIRLLVTAKANVNHMGSIMSTHNSPKQSLLSRSLNTMNQVSMVRSNALDIIKFLVDNGANVNGDQEKVDSALIEAVRMQDVEIVKFLLEHGANGKHQGMQGFTALHVVFMDHTMSYDFENIMEALLEHRADTNVKADNGETPLHVSLRQKVPFIQKLITTDLKPNVTDNEGVSYLMLAAQQGAVDVCQELLNIGANCSLVDSKGNSALHYACSLTFNIKILEILLENGCNINLLNNDGQAPINISYNARSLSVFLKNGADPNLCKENFKSPLIIAIERKGLDDVVGDLLERGANVNHRGPSKYTALHVALDQDTPDRHSDHLAFSRRTLETRLGEIRRENIVIQLLQAGADVNALTSDGLTPLAVLLRNTQWENEDKTRLLSKLLECNADPNLGENPPICFAAETLNILFIKKLLEVGVDINKPNKEGKSPLCCCLQRNIADDHYWSKQEDETNLLRLLLLHNANPNVEDLEGNSPLNIALSGKASIQEIQCLLKAGADPLHKGKDNFNAYEQALVKDWTYLEILFKECGSDYITNDFCCMFWKKVFEWNKKKKYMSSYDIKQQSSYTAFIEVSLSILASKEGIDVDVTNEEGTTPLIIYSRLNEYTVVTRLLERGADVNHVDENGQDALHALFSFQDEGTKRETIELLVEHGCDFYTKDVHGDNLLFDAAKRGDFPVINQLIQMGADCAAKSDLGLGVMHLCLQNSSEKTPLKECLDCIKTYRNYGGLLTETDTSNNTLILLFLCSKLFPLVSNDESELEEIMDLLAINKGTVNIKNSFGLTPMLRAAYLGSYKCITMLWERGAKLNIWDISDNSPLHAVLSKVAIPSDVFRDVMFFVDKGVDVNSKNCLEETPLYLALAKIQDKNIRLNVVKLLLSKGANPNVGCTECLPLVKALQLHDVASTIQLLQHGAKTIIQNANQSSSVLKYLMQDYYCSLQSKDLGDICQIIVVINEKNNINTTLPGGENFLHLAIREFRHYEQITELIKLILDLGADVNAKDSLGNSALSNVLLSNLNTNSAAVGELLLENGANPNGEFLLSKMLEEMKSRHRFYLYKRLAKKLLDHGADPNLYGKQTPNLILAVRTRDISTVKRLLEKGANVKEQDCDGSTSLHTAVSSDYKNSEHRKEMVSLLLSHQVNICTKDRIGKNALLLEIKRMMDEIKKQRPTDGSLIVDLSVFNALICGGSDFVQARQRMSFDGDLGTSLLVMLMKVGMFRASTTLLMCGYPSDKDQELEKFDISQYDWSSFDGYRRYKRINYEIDLRNLETTIDNAKSEEIPSLVLKCREAIRNHILCCTQGAEIESKISLLPIPRTLKSFLSFREYTFEEEIIELMDSTTNNYDENIESTNDDSEDYDSDSDEYVYSYYTNNDDYF